jgi:hypothetical protein
MALISVTQSKQYFNKTSQLNVCLFFTFQLCPYPSEDEMQNRLQNTVDWKAYRTGIMLKTIKTIKPKRPVKESVSI